MMTRAVGICLAASIAMGCSGNPLGRVLESEGIAAPAGAENASASTDYPADSGPATQRPNLAGKWISGLADPLEIQQDGDRVFGKFDRNGTFDCKWNQKSRFNCTWKSDQGEGLMQLWWETDRPVGHRVNKTTGGEWLEIDFSPWTDKRGSGGVSGPPSDGSCSNNAHCSDYDTRCIDGRCVKSAGTKCTLSTDCSQRGNRFDCKNQVCTPAR